MELAQHVANWSKDPSTKVGAVVSGVDKVRISLGYNGFPPRIKDDERLTIREKKYGLVIHAEENALANALFDVRGASIYTTHFPCINCSKTIIARGLSYLVARKPTTDFLQHWGKDIPDCEAMFKEAGLKIIWLS